MIRAMKITTKRPMSLKKSTSKSSSVKFSRMKRFRLIKLSKKIQRVIFYIVLVVLFSYLISVFTIFFWEVKIGLDLSHYQFMFGIYTTTTFPISVGMSVLFFVLVPTLITFKALADIRTRQYEQRGIRFIYLSTYLFTLTATFGLTHVGLKFYDVYDINQRLKQTLLRSSYLYAQNDNETVLELNDLHRQYVCCGIENVTSWMEIKHWMPEVEFAVPHSCCRPEYDGPCYNQGLNTFYPRTDVIKSIYLRGCRKLLHRYFRTTIRPIFFYLFVIFLSEIAVVFLLLIFVQNFVITPKIKLKKLTVCPLKVPGKKFGRKVAYARQYVKKKFEESDSQIQASVRTDTYSVKKKKEYHWEDLPDISMVGRPKKRSKPRYKIKNRFGAKTNKYSVKGSAKGKRKITRRSTM